MACAEVDNTVNVKASAINLIIVSFSFQTTKAGAGRSVKNSPQRLRVFHQSEEIFDIGQPTVGGLPARILVKHTLKLDLQCGLAGRTILGLAEA
jgi:hypothetical protein